MGQDRDDRRPPPLGQVIAFPKKKRQQDLTPGAAELKALSDAIDAIVREALHNGTKPQEVAGLLAHRLGTLIRPIGEKEELWHVCERVLKRQAILD